MPRIQILPENIARKIAAGEVIERPASVVKELCENAFDAGAKNVQVEVWEGGLSLIRVRDDGCGMEPEDLKRCYLPHATSKIHREEDLLKIRTWGFRGEALASIAAVSELNISSRARGALIGGKVRIRYGKFVSFTERGLAPGTVVEVCGLFSNVPARKAFLKSPRAEAARISEIVKLLAFENPQVNLSLSLAGKEAFRYRSAEGRKGLLAKVSGLKKEALLEEVCEEGPYRLRAIISPQEPGFPTARHYYFLVNNRIVKDRLLAAATNEALKSFFPRGKYPALLLVLEVSPELVDVNVHPAKWEVRFREEARVFSLVKTLLEKFFSPSISIKREDPSPPEDLPLQEQADEKEELWDQFSFRVKEPEVPFGTTPKLFSAEKAKVLAPLGEEFFILKEGEEIIFFDFHAAQERLLFEKLKEDLARKGKITSQRLLKAEALHLSGRAFERLEENLSLLERLGFEIEFFSPGEVLLRAVPAILGLQSLKALEQFLEEGPSGKLLEDVLASLACKAAKKAGDFPPSEEILKLYQETRERKLEHCPHGRPFKWRVSLEEVRKRLGRRL